MPAYDYLGNPLPVRTETSFVPIERAEPKESTLIGVEADAKSYPAVGPDNRPIPTEQLQQAIAQGQVFPGPTGKIAMLAPSGERRLVEGESDYQDALRAGYQVEPFELQQRREDEARYSTPGQKALALGEGAIRGGLPFVGEKLLQWGASPATQEAERKRIEANPLTSTIGEVGGMGAAMLLSGGLSGASKAAQLAGAAPWAAVSLPGRAAAATARALLGAAGSGERAVQAGARIAQMAGEGAAIGASQEMAAMDRAPTPLEAEQAAHALLRGAAHGAVFGAGAELGLQVLGAAGRSLASKILPEGPLSESLAKHADRAAFSTSMATPDDVKALKGPERADALGRRLREYRFTGEHGPEGKPLLGRVSKADELLEPVTAAKREVESKFREMESSVTREAREARILPDVRGFVERADAIIRPLEESLIGGTRREAAELRRQIGGIIDRVREATEGRPVPHVLLPEERALAESNRVALGKFAEVMRTNAEDLGEALEVSHKQFTQELASKLQSAKVDIPSSVDLSGLGELLASEPRAYGEMLRHDFDEFLHATADKLGGATPAMRFDVKFGPPLELDEVIRSRRHLADQVYSEKKKFMGPAGPPPPAVENLRKLERALADTVADTGERALSKLGRDPSEWRSINRELHDWIDLEDLYEKTAARKVGHRKYGLGASIAGAAGAVAAATVMAHGHSVGLLGIAAAPMHKMVSERGSALEAAVFGGLAEAVNSSSARLSMASNAVALGAKAKSAIPLAAAFLATRRAPVLMITDSEAKQRMAELETWKSSTLEAKIDDSIGKARYLSDERPRLASSAAMVLMRQNDYLADTLPTPMVSDAYGLGPQKQTQVFATIDVERFKTRLRAIDDPAWVVETLADGGIDPDAWDAIRATYPAMYQEVQQTILRAVQQRDQPLDHDTARSLGLVFGLPVTPELVISEVEANQSAIRAQQQAQQPQQRGQVNPPGLATIAQNLEQRGTNGI